MIKIDTIFGLVILLFLQQIKYLGLGVRLARWGYKTRTGVLCILRRHCIGVWRYKYRFFLASIVFILRWEARVGHLTHTKMSSLIAVMGYEVNKRKRTT